MKGYPLLFTGCNRSGSHFLQSLLQKAGLEIGHNRTLRSAGAVSAYFAPRSVREERGVYFDHVVHFRRHPMDVINSMCTAAPSTWKEIFEHVPEIYKNRSRGVVPCIALFWLYWNRIAEDGACYSFSVERTKQSVLELNEIVAPWFGNRISPEMCDAALSDRDSRRERAEYGRLCFDDVRAELREDELEQLVSMARRYGYDLEEGAAFTVSSDSTPHSVKRASERMTDGLLLLHAQGCADAGELARAEQTTKAHLDEYGATPYALLFLARILFRRRAFEEAEGFLEEVLREGDDYLRGEAYRFRSGIRYQESDLVGAVKDAASATECIPTRPGFHHYLGRLHWERGELEEAARAHEDAIACDPTHAAALYELSTSYHALGHEDKAREYAVRAAEAEPTNKTFRRWRRKLRTWGRGP